MSILSRITLSLVALMPLSPAWAGEASPEEKPPAGKAPIVRTADLDLGEAQEVELADGGKVRLKLLDLEEVRDPLRNAVREARVRVEVSGETVTLASAMYHLPVTVAGVQIDCPITRGLTDNSSKQNVWGLTKHARFRVWPAGSPWLEPGTFTYPVRQRWFASDTQMANEPTFVNGDERTGKTSIYYHYGLDFGGAEGLVEVVAATDGTVVSAAGETLAEHKDSPAKPRYDVIYVVDQRGWYYRYSHLMTVEVKPGQRVRMGQRIGLLGKEGGSGGWSHLHFDITSRQPSGLWGIQDAYAYAWEAYRKEYAPQIIAVARPHHLVAVGGKVKLDGSKSWSAAGQIARYEWTCTDGSRAAGPVVERTYARPGTYSEILQVTDAAGQTAWDFAVVQVADPAPVRRGSPDPAETADRQVSRSSRRPAVGDVARSGDRPQPASGDRPQPASGDRPQPASGDRPQPELPPTIHAAYFPTTNLRPGDPITFKVRTFRTTHGEERWDFGDGSPPVTVQSDGNANVHAKDGYAVTQHAYAKPGDYLARVLRTNERGETAIGHVHIRIEPPFEGRTSVSIRDGKWHINGQVTYPGTRAEGLLMNVRMVNSVFEDRRQPAFDAQANTDAFLKMVPDYAAHGVRALTICLQGGMPGYEGALNSAFDPDGALRESYLARVRQVIEACDRQGLAVILGCYYQRQDQLLADETAVRTGTLHVADWVQRNGYHNVVLETANEFDHKGFDHRILRTVEGQTELIRLIKARAPGLLVSASGLGHGRFPDALAETADFLLIHFNGTPLDAIPACIAALQKHGKPIVCNEDDKTGEAAARAAELSVANGASWGLMLKDVNQYFPLEFHGAADDPVVYRKLRELTSP